MPPADVRAAGAAPRWTLVVASVASLMVALDLLAVSTALSSMRHDLHASVVQLQWTITG